MEIDEFLSATRGFTLVEKLELSMDDGHKSVLTIRLRDDIEPGSASVEIEFGDVTELRLGPWGGGWCQIMWLEIEDVRAHQLDRIKYRVTEFEHEVIAFSCWSFGLKGRS
jgi:hypothetical protein